MIHPVLAALLGAALWAACGPQSRAEQPPAPLIVLPAGFAPEKSANERELWISVALEEGIALRLRDVPGLLVMPPGRSAQARAELEEPQRTPEWRGIAELLGAHVLITGAWAGNPEDLHLDLQVIRLRGDSARSERRAVPPGRLLEVIDRAAEVAAGHISGREFAAARPLCRSASALEYYARAVLALRAQKSSDALHYLTEALQFDDRFRPALGLLAEVEMRLSPAGRAAGAARFRTLDDLARAARDPADSALAEFGQAGILQAGGSFEAACARYETALFLFEEAGDRYGVVAVMNALAQAYALRTTPPNVAWTDATRTAFRRNNLLRAIEWQELAVAELQALDDQVSLAPVADRAARLNMALGDAERELERRQTSLAAARRCQSRRNQAAALTGIAEWHARKSDWKAAAEAARGALPLAPSAALPGIHATLGGFLMRLQRADEALAQFQAGAEVAASNGDFAAQVLCLRQAAVLLTETGDAPRAREFEERAANIARQHGVVPR